MVLLYALISVIIVSLISLFAAIPLLIKKKISKRTLLFLLSTSVGIILSTVFIDFLPEIFEHGYSLSTSIIILSGFLLMFIIEKFVHHKHNRKCEQGDRGHGHAYSLAPMNLIGDGVHNFIDGLVIAASYTVDITLGIVATISIIFHEIPQELADFGVLLYSGLAKKKALLFNLLSGVAAIIGTLIGLFLANKSTYFTDFILPFAVGNFIYIAASNLIPQLHKRCKLIDTILHILAFIIGIGIIVLVSFLGPSHGH